MLLCFPIVLGFGEDDSDQSGGCSSGRRNQNVPKAFEPTMIVTREVDAPRANSVRSVSKLNSQREFTPIFAFVKPFLQIFSPTMIVTREVGRFRANIVRF